MLDISFIIQNITFAKTLTRIKKQGCAPIKLIKSVIKPMVTCEIIFQIYFKKYFIF